METGALSRVISEPGDPVGKTRARQKGKAGGRKERVAKGGGVERISKFGF